MPEGQLMGGIEGKAYSLTFGLKLIYCAFVLQLGLPLSTVCIG